MCGPDNSNLCVTLCKGIKDSFGFWIPCRGFWILDSTPWILDCGFHTVDSGFWIPRRGFQIPGTGFRILCQWNLDSGYLSCIPDSTSKNFPDSRIWIPLHGAKLAMRYALISSTL